MDGQGADVRPGFRGDEGLESGEYSGSGMWTLARGKKDLVLLGTAPK